MDNKKFIYEMVIKEHHLDSFAHVNNAEYLKILEEARWEFIHDNGYGLEEIQRLKKGPVILEVNLKFIKELKLREKIQIHTQCIDFNKKILKLEQKILNTNNEICTLALFTLAFFDLNQRKIIETTPEWVKAIGIKAN